MTTIKVIHVHLIFERIDFYFGSIAALFNTLDEHRVGIKRNTLIHARLKEGISIPTHKAIIKQSRLIRTTTTHHRSLEPQQTPQQPIENKNSVKIKR